MINLEQRYLDVMDSCRPGSIEEILIKEVYAHREGLPEITKFTDTNLPEEGVLYSYGDPEKLERQMECGSFEPQRIHVSDAGKIMVPAVSNFLRISGCPVENTKVGADYLHRELELNSRFSHLYDIPLPLSAHTVHALIGKSSDGRVEVDKMDPLSAEDIAYKLDHGHRGLFLHNAGVRNGTLQEGEYADSIATFQTAVRDSDGNLKGFYICDAGTDETKQFVSAENLEQSLKVQGGTLFFTKDSFVH